MQRDDPAVDSNTVNQTDEPQFPARQQEYQAVTQVLEATGSQHGYTTAHGAAAKQRSPLTPSILPKPVLTPSTCPACSTIPSTKYYRNCATS